MRGTFQNEPLTDFSLEANRKKMEEAIREFSSTFGKEYDCFIGGKPVRFQETFVSRNPSKPSEIVGVFPKARNEDAEKALLAAEKAFESWKRVPAKERADLLFLAADGMRERRFLHNASMVLEAGKTWPEADGDTAEAIDFLEFYGREALRYAGEQPVTPFPGERPELRYIPLGVGLVIPPWNFPLAILCGMTSAAIAAGNTVVLKPSSETPVIGALFNDLMRSVGVPDGVLNFITGPGAVGGDYLVRHPRTRFISFTGSKEVGLGVIEKAGKAAPGQIWIKRVVAEMGGKDAIVVDSEADLDAAAAAVSASSRRPVRPRRARSGSSASSPRWGERTRSWSIRKPISTPRPPPSPRPHSASKARNAPRARARSSSPACTTRSSKSSSRSSERSKSAIRATSRTRWGRS